MAKAGGVGGISLDQLQGMGAEEADTDGSGDISEEELKALQDLDPALADKIKQAMGGKGKEKAEKGGEAKAAKEEEAPEEDAPDETDEADAGGGDEGGDE